MTTDRLLNRAIIPRDGMRASFLDQGRLDGRQLLARARMWVHRCASINADACASVPFKLYAMGGTTSKAIAARGWGRPLTAREKAHVTGRTDCVPAMTAKGAVYDTENMTVIERHPLLDVLQDVNPYSSGFDWRVGLYYDLDIFGSAYTHLLQAGGRPTALWRMLPHITQVMPSRENFIEGFEYGETTDRQMFVPDEVLWFKLFDPQNPYGGLSPLQAWWKTVDTSMHIEDFRHDLMENHGSPDYIVTEANMSAEQKRDFRRSWKRMFGKFFRRFSNIGFMDGTGKLERLSDTNRELEFNASADQVRDSILAAFGTPKSFVTSDDVNRANAREGTNVWMRTTLWPKIQRVEDTLNEQYVERWSGTLMLIHDNPIREDETIAIANRKSKLESGWTINEVRADEGEEGIGPDGDEPLVGQGLKTVESVINPPAPPPMLAPGADAEDEDGSDGADERGDSVPDSGDDVGSGGDAAGGADEADREGSKSLDPASGVGAAGGDEADADEGGAGADDGRSEGRVGPQGDAHAAQHDALDALIKSLDIIERLTERDKPENSDDGTGNRCGCGTRDCDDRGSVVDHLEQQDDSAPNDDEGLAAGGGRAKVHGSGDGVDGGGGDEAAGGVEGGRGAERSDRGAQAGAGVVGAGEEGGVSEVDGGAYEGDPRDLPADISKLIDTVHRLTKDREAGKPDGQAFLGKPDVRAVASIQSGLIDYIGTVMDRVKRQTGPKMAGVDVLVPEQEQEELADRIGRDIRPHIERAYEEKAEQAIADLRELEQLGDVGISFNLENRRAQEAIATQTRRVSVYVSTGLQSELRETVIEALDLGISSQELTKKIEDKFYTGAKYRAERIARTELAYAHMAGSIEGWAQSTVVVGKQWVLAPDACPVCKAIAGQFGDGLGEINESKTLGLHDTFYKVGDKIQYRGENDEPKVYNVEYVDVTGPPIHPQCLLPETPVRAVGVVSGMRSWYDGPAIRITTAEGRSLSVTAKHKFLTPDGFATADSLRVGDDLVHARVGERVLDGDPHDDERHTPIEDVVASLSESSGVTAMTVPVSTEHFHGDGRCMDGNVDVVRTDSELWRRLEAASLQHDGELPLCGIRDGGRLPRLGDLHSMLCGLSLAAHGAMSSAREFLPLGGGHAGHSEHVGLGAAANRNTATLEPQCKGAATYTEFFTECQQALAGLVSTDEIVNIERLHWTGHVYDLQTYSGIYSASGIITSNCRCDLRPILDTD